MLVGTLCNASVGLAVDRNANVFRPSRLSILMTTLPDSFPRMDNRKTFSAVRSQALGVGMGDTRPVSKVCVWLRPRLRVRRAKGGARQTSGVPLVRQTNSDPVFV